MTLSDLAGLGTGVCLGVASLYLRMAVRTEPVPKVIWFVAAFGTITLSPWAIPALQEFATHGGQSVALTSGLFLFVAAGLTGQVIGRTFLYSCIDRIGPSLATAYKTAVPLLTAIFAWLVFREQISTLAATGIAAVVAGILLIALYQPRPISGNATPLSAAKNESAVGQESSAPITGESVAHEASGSQSRTPLLPPGLALGIGAVLFYSASDLFRKGGMDALPSPTAGTWVGNLLTLVVFTIQYGLQRRLKELVGWNTGALRALLVASTLVTIAYVLFLVGVGTAGVAVTSALAAIEPLAALVIGKAFYRDQEPIQARQVPGVVFVVIGVALIVVS